MKKSSVGGQGVMDGIMCETLEKLGFAKGVEIFNEAPKWYA